MNLVIIVAIDKSGGIGFDGKIPWEKISEDLRFFRNITTMTVDSNKQNCIIMGRKTWESLSTKPLPKRINIVMTNDRNYDFGDNKPDFIAYSKDDVYKYITTNNINIEYSYIIGGSEIYNLFIDDVNDIYITYIKNKYKCDKFFNIQYIKTKFNIIKEIKSKDIMNIVYLVRKDKQPLFKNLLNQ